ncbi:MAG: hypothetical protein HY909_09355 [Deltaproteobacteria bacterium]|nr:hypothetical protein [Deltaproteobacteria bacterium]
MDVAPTETPTAPSAEPRTSPAEEPPAVVTEAPPPASAEASTLSPSAETALSPGAEAALPPGAEAALPPGAETTPPMPPSAEVPAPVAALPVLPETVGALTGRDREPLVPPLDPDALPASQAMAQEASAPGAHPSARGSTWDPIARHLAEQALREGAWGRLLRGLALVLGSILGLRLVFDPMLPKVLLALIVGASVVALVSMGLLALALARRQRVLVLALRQLALLARRDALRDTVGPRLDAVLDSLREEPRVWPLTRRDPPRG